MISNIHNFMLPFKSITKVADLKSLEKTGLKATLDIIPEEDIEANIQVVEL